MNKSKIWGIASLFAAMPVTSIALLASSCPPRIPNPGTGEFANDKYASSRFDQTNDGKIKLGVTFTKDKPQWNALAGAIKKYNEVMKDTPGYMPVELVSIGTGYSAGTQQIQSWINSKAKNELPNLVALYNPIAATLAKNGMLLNFRDKDESISIKKDSVSNVFNSEIENVVNEGLWSIPAMKSTNAAGINAPVLSYILEKMVEKGIKIDSSFQSQYNDIKDKGKNDRARVQTLWGNLVANADQLIKDSDIKTISESTFTTFKDLLAFAKLAQQLFENAAKTNPDVHFLGIDDIAGTLNTVAYSSINAKSSDFYATLENRDGDRVVSYNNLKSSDKNISRQMSEIYNSLKDAMAKKSVVLMGAGDYTSNYEKTHNYAMGIGSTAGYSYNFVKDGQTTYKLNLTNGNDSYSTTMHQRDVKFDSAKNAVTFGPYKNKVVKSTENKGKYDWKLENPEADTKWGAEIEKIKSDPTSYRLLSLDVTSNAEDISTLDSKFSDVATKIGKIATDEKGTKFDKVLYTIKLDNTKAKEESLDNNSTLGESEFFTLQAPTKYIADNKKHVTFGQGPSLIGIHANDAENKATKMFVKWLVETKTKYDFAKSYNNKGVASAATVSETPVEHVSRIASYIFPVSGFENSPFSTPNKCMMKAYEMFKKAATESSRYTIFEELAGENSDKFRDAFKSTFQAIYNKLKNGSTVGDFQTEVINSLIAQKVL